MRNRLKIAALLVAAVLAATPVHAERIKDLAKVRGVRPNQLIGYGLIVGLDGTGDSDKTRFTIQSVVSMLSRMNVRINAAGLKLKNVAAVMVTAELPPFARAGNKIDVHISSIGDAKSLSGGSLLMTPLKGLDGQIYAIAQGPISVGGFSVESQGGARETKNHPTAGRIPSGALVEREVPTDIVHSGKVTLQLDSADFTTAARLAKVVNMNLGGRFAKAIDSGTVDVDLPPPYRDRIVEFVATIERLEVTPDTVAKVIVNERTGTIIMGQDVRISPVAVAHGNLTISVQVDKQAVPAAPLTPGETEVVQNEQLQVEEEKNNLIELQGGATLSDLVQGLNRLGASPRDLITILQAIKQAGALRAHVEVI